MKSFSQCLLEAKGSTIKARTLYCRSRNWRTDAQGVAAGWYVAWERGLLPLEVEAAIRARGVS